MPFKVAFPESVVFPDTVNSLLKSPELADTTNLPVELPSNIVFDVETRAVEFANNPEVEKLAELIVPVWYSPVVFAIKLDPIENELELILPEALAKPVIVTLPLFNVFVTVSVSCNDVAPETVNVLVKFPEFARIVQRLVLFPNPVPSFTGIRSPAVVIELRTVPPIVTLPETLKLPSTLLVLYESNPKSIFNLLFAVAI